MRNCALYIVIRFRAALRFFKQIHVAIGEIITRRRPIARALSKRGVENPQGNVAE